MPIPESLEALMDHGVVEQVVRPLLSGKEAEVFLVVSEGEYRVAKVYKEAHNRTFRNRATYTEGRKVRNSRDQRAMAKRTSHGKAKDEAAWRSTEVDMIYKLEAAGVRVPTPYHFVDNILIMELVQSAEGEPAPRLGELELTAADAKLVYDQLLAEVVRMLSAGIVHGDLSEFNVLMGHAGPCIIDFPQSVHAASNANARTLLLRDVSNLHRFLERFAPGRRALPYGEEMWELYEKGELTPTTALTGTYTPSTAPAEVDVVMAIIEEAKRDERMRQQRLGIESRGYGRKKSAAAAAPLEEQRSRSAQAPEHGGWADHCAELDDTSTASPGNERAAGNRNRRGDSRGPAPQPNGHDGQGGRRLGRGAGEGGRSAAHNASRGAPTRPAGDGGNRAPTPFADTQQRGRRAPGRAADGGSRHGGPHGRAPGESGGPQNSRRAAGPEHGPRGHGAAPENHDRGRHSGGGGGTRNSGRGDNSNSRHANVHPGGTTGGGAAHGAANPHTAEHVGHRRRSDQQRSGHQPAGGPRGPRPPAKPRGPR